METRNCGILAEWSESSFVTKFAPVGFYNLGINGRYLTLNSKKVKGTNGCAVNTSSCVRSAETTTQTKHNIIPCRLTFWATVLSLGKICLTTEICWCLAQSLPCWESPGRYGIGWGETHPWKVFPRRIRLLRMEKEWPREGKQQKTLRHDGKQQKQSSP